jgi:hypothetical protein
MLRCERVQHFETANELRTEFLLPEGSSKLTPSPQSSPVRDCVVMGLNLRRVILNEVKNLDLSIGSKRRDPSAAPQDDITTQSREGEEEEKNWYQGKSDHNSNLGEGEGT